MPLGRLHAGPAAILVATAVLAGCSPAPAGAGGPTRTATHAAPPPATKAARARRVHRRRRPAYVPARLRLPGGRRWPGEGVWRRRDRWAGHAPSVLTTTYAEPGGTTAYIAWFSAATTRLAAYPGTSDPPVGGPRAGEVPARLRRRLLATFNGGFKYAASPGGLISQGVEYAPLRPGLATVWETWNHRAGITAWPGGAGPTHGLEVARQDLTLLVRNGRPTPLAADPAAWGATLGGGVTVWRTALGIDAHHDFLYVAADTTPLGLAQVLAHAGAVSALELDINPEWPTLNVYGLPGGGSPSMVVPNPQESAGRYLVPDSRDFFAVYAR